MGKYIKSPLGKIIADTLLKINELRVKYPAHKKDIIEKAHADRVLNVIETVLNKLHTDVLPKFDDQNKPGLVGIIKDLYGLKGLREHLITRKYRLFQDIEKILPTLIESAVKQTPKKGSVNETLIQLLRHNKTELIKNAAKIPGTNLDELFIEFEDTLKLLVIAEQDPKEVIGVLKNVLFDTEDKKYKLDIHHPMIFELAEAIAGFIKAAPTELKDLVPFFNPEALEADLHTGITGSIISGLLGRTILLENVKNGDSTPSFTYNLRTFYKGHEYPETFAGSELYNENFGFIPHMFESEKARADLLQQLVEAESDYVASQVMKHRQETEKTTDYEQHKGKALIFALQSDLRNLDEFAIVNKHMQRIFKDRTTCPVDELLSSHTVLKAQMRIDRDTNHLDVSYLKDRLPESLVGYSNKTRKTAIIPLRTIHDSAIKAGVNDLMEIHGQAEHKRSQLTASLNHAIDAWKKEMLEEHAKRIINSDEQLKHYQETLGKITLASEPVASLSEVERLENEIMVFEQKAKESESLVQSVTLLLTDLKKSTLSSDDIELDSNGSLRADQNKISQPLIEATQKLIDDIHRTQQQQQKESVKLISRLEKAKADAEFVKNLTSANPQQMRELLNQAEGKLKLLQEKQATLAEQGQLIRLEQESTKLALETLQATREKQRSTLVEITARDDKLLDEIFAIIEKHDLPNAGEWTKEKLLNQGDFLQNLGSLIDELKHALAVQQEYVVGLQTPQYYKNLEIIFNQVNDLLSKNKNQFSIPFTAIDKVPGLAGSRLPNSLSGFNLLINLIGLDKERDWKEYRTRQDDLFRFKPEKKEFIAAISSLLGKIELATLANKKDLATSEKDKELLTEINASVLKLWQIRSDLQSDIEQKIKIQAELADSSKLDELNEATKDLQKRLEDNNLEIAPLAKESQQLQNTISALKPITEILEKLNVLNEKISTFAEKRSDFMVDKSLFTSVSELRALQKELAPQISKAKEDISKLDNAVDYQANLMVINQVFAATNERLTREINVKFNAEFLQQLINNSEEKLTKLNESHAKLIKMITKEDIQSLLDNYSDLAQSLNDNHALFTALDSQFSVIQAAYCSQEINAKRESHKQLQNRAEQYGLNLADELITLFNAQAVQATLFNIKTPDESKATQQENSKKLVEIRTLVALTFPDKEVRKLLQATAMCANSDKIVKKLEAVKQAKINALEQLLLNEQVNKDLLSRIEERDVTIQDLMRQLDDYLKTNVSEERVEFFQLLVQALEAYKESGDSSKLVNTIGDNISRFRDFHLEALLYKIKITVIDLNRKIPVDYYQPELEVRSEELHTQAQEVLKLQSAQNWDYVKKIQDLYARINGMKAHGTLLKEEDEACSTIAVNLADKLKNDVDHFVVANRNELPSIEAYDTFKDEFSARLHSEDSAMSKHRSSWKPIVANVFIGLITVGIAIGLKLLHSQMTTNRYTLFFDKTERQEHLSAIEESVKTIAVSA